MNEVDELNIVLGYGCHLTAIVRRYLEGAAASIKTQPPERSLVITTGGRTALESAPGVSEAGLMASHLQALGVRAPILLEEDARTTVENIRNVARMVRERGIAAHRISIFGDRARARKILALARFFFGPRSIRMEAQNFERRWWQTLVHSTIAVPFDLLMARVPVLERLSLIYIERRNRRS